MCWKNILLCSCQGTMWNIFWLLLSLLLVTYVLPKWKGVHVAVVLCPTCFTRFCFNASCTYVPLINLCSHNFGSTPFGWLCCSMQTPSYSSMYLLSENSFWFMPTFSETQLGHKIRVLCTMKQQSQSYLIQTFHSTNTPKTFIVDHNLFWPIRK